MRSMLVCAAFLTLLAACDAPAPTQEQPDFTGVWSLASRPMTSAQGYPNLAFSPEGKEKVDAYRALVDPAGENPTQYCVSHGMPEMMMGGGGYPLEIIHKADQVTMIGEYLSETRRVYLGKRIADDSDVVPSRAGYSKGHWEGDVLVVETNNLQDLPDARYPHSADAKITERFQLKRDEDGTPRLVADTVFEDKWLAEPLTYRLEWKPSAQGWMLPYECREQDWLDHLDGLAAKSGKTGR